MPNTNSSTASDVNIARPQVLDHFVGQLGVIERIKVALEAAWADGTPLPHMLLTGPPGLGKTQLAQILAREMGVELKEALGQTLNAPMNMRGFLLTGEDRDVLFIDEIHELHRGAETFLYRAMEERKLCLIGLNGQDESIDLSDFTLIAATTDQYQLLQPLLDRFRIIAHFRKYSRSELAQLLDQRCRLLGWTVADDVLNRVAARGRGTPRLALRLLESCFRTSRAAGSDTIDIHHFHRTCRLERLDAAGLDEVEQRYLKLLERSGGSIRLNVAASHMCLPTQTIQKVVEAGLVEDGFIEKTDVGLRTLTGKGRRHLASDAENENETIEGNSHA